MNDKFQMELSRKEVPLYGQARVFVLIPSLTESEEVFVVLEGSSVLHVLQTKIHTLTYFITPGHNLQETVCVRAYTCVGDVLRYVGVSFLTYKEDDAQQMAEYLVTHSNRLSTTEHSDLICRYGLSDSRARAEMDQRVALALANLQTNHNLLHYTHESLLHVCVRLGFVHVCEFLLSQPGALMLINSANQEGDTPLELAHRTNQHALVHLLTHPPNPLASPLVGVSHVQINSSHLLRFIHASALMSLSVCVWVCVSESQLHSAVLLLRECVTNSTLMNKISSLCSRADSRLDQDSLTSSSDDLQSCESPHTDSNSSCSEAEDEELLLSISSDVSENERNVTLSSAAAEFNESDHAEEETPLVCITQESLLCPITLLSVNEGSEEEKSFTPPPSTEREECIVPLKAATLSMLLCSSSRSSPALFVSSHNNSSSHRRRSNSEGCGHDMAIRKSWSLIGQSPCEMTSAAPLDYSAESWSVIVDSEFSHSLDRQTVKRQEVIYELMQTEFHHVQTLAVMIDVLRRGLLEEVQLEQDVIGQIFPGLDDLRSLHRMFLRTMESRRHASTQPSNNRNYVIQQIGDILLQQFSGSCAVQMTVLYGDFCSKHSEALKVYKQLQQSNRKLQMFLRQQSSNSVIKRREIPEFLLLITQRITKYPVLLERLLQHTHGGVAEHGDITAALEGMRCVLSGVESHVEKFQRARKLDDIISRLDNKSFTRLKSGEIYSKHTLIHTTHTLTHCSNVTCRTTSGRLRDVLAIMLSDVLVFLQEKEQKFTFAALEHKPAVVPLHGLILREIANQDRGLFLISSDVAEPEMYEIHTHTREERERWITLLQHSTHSLPENDLKNNKELKDIHTLQEALFSFDLQVCAVLEKSLRVCVGSFSHRHLLVQPHTHASYGAMLLKASQTEVINLLVSVMPLIFSNQNIIQYVEVLSKKSLKRKEPVTLKIIKVVESMHGLTQILYSLLAAVIMQDSMYELQKLRLLEEEPLPPGTDTESKVDGDVLSVCSADLELRERKHTEELDRMKIEREELEAELEQWVEQIDALREEEAELERERRWVQQEERRMRKERERLERKLCLSRQNSTNHQRRLSFLIPVDKLVTF